MVDPMQVIVSVLLFAGVFLLIYAVFGYPVKSEPPSHWRFASAMGVAGRQTVFESALLSPVMSLFMQAATRLNWQGLRDKIRKDLDASGNRNGYSVSEYLAICLASSVLMAGVSSFVSLTIVGDVGLGVGTVMGVLGFAVPILSLSQSARNRLTKISKQLPYTLDLISLMMAAGSTFTEAVDTIVRDDESDPFNQELRIVRAEIDFGSSRAVALANMAQRLPIDSVRSIIGAVNQAESLGTPLSTILKNQANMLRVHRSVRAEKLGASASLRILIPSMLILIAAVMVVFGPMIVRFITRGSLM
ncbi:MAG: hypothetical protein GC164_05600 [Phycisphaera sp.]|nr:hypothetical protein [Phycisphaera sp.]